MGRYRASTGLREIINEKKSISLGTAAAMLAFAGAYFAYISYSHRPQIRPNGDKAFYTVDGGQTWFVDSIYKTPPFDHEGKVAVRAMVYSYDNGRNEFCPFVQRYTSNMKEALDEAVSQARREGRPLSSILLFNSPDALDGVEIKAAGSGDWVARSSRNDAAKILSSVKAPDGSAVDFVIP